MRWNLALNLAVFFQLPISFFPLHPLVVMLTLQERPFIGKNEPLPLIAPGPFEWGGYCRSRLDGGLEKIRRERDYLALLLRIEGLTARVAQWVVGMNQARHPALFHDVSGCGDDHRWNTVLLQMPRDQTHGLVANGSDRHHEGDVDLIFQTAPQHLWCVDFKGSALTVGSQYAVTPGRQGTQSSVRDQIP